MAKRKKSMSSSQRLTMEREQNRVLATIAKYQQQLKAYPGVLRIAVGHKYTRHPKTQEHRMLEDTLAIRVYVVKKLKRLRQDQLLPTELDGIPVDVVESRKYRLYANRDAVFNPICGGIATYSSNHPLEIGTLGAVVKDADSGAPCAISNCHVWSGPGAQNGDSVFQGLPGPNSIQIGTLFRAQPQFDAALCLLNPAASSIPELLELVPSVSGIRSPLIKSRVRKSGRTTDVTAGIVSDVAFDSFAVIVDPDQPPINNELSRGGDSGSVVIDEDDFAVGLLSGGDPDTDPFGEYYVGYRMDQIAPLLRIMF